MMCEHYLCAHALLAVETVQEFLEELTMKQYVSSREKNHIMVCVGDEFELEFSDLSRAEL